MQTVHTYKCYHDDILCEFLREFANSKLLVVHQRYYVLYTQVVHPLKIMLW